MAPLNPIHKRKSPLRIIKLRPPNTPPLAMAFTRTRETMLGSSNCSNIIIKDNSSSCSINTNLNIIIPNNNINNTTPTPQCTLTYSSSKDNGTRTC